MSEPVTNRDPEREGALTERAKMHPQQTPTYSITTRIDERIADSESPSDAAFFTQIRGELIRQDIERERHIELIKAQRRYFWFRVASTFVFLGVGVGLAETGSSLAGFFIIGGSISLLAPDYVKNFVRMVYGRNDNNG